MRRRTDRSPSGERCEHPPTGPDEAQGRLVVMVADPDRRDRVGITVVAPRIDARHGGRWF